MDTSRLAAMLPLLVSELESLGSALYPIRDNLKKGATAEIPALRKEFANAVAKAPSLRFVPSWIRMIDALGGRALHGREVARRAAAILDQSEYTSQNAGMLIESLEGEIDLFRRRLGSLHGSLTGLGVQPDLVPTNKCELGVLFPEGSFHDLDEFAREIAQLDRNLRPLIELSGSNAGLHLRSLAMGSFDVFALTDLIAGGTIATVLVGITTAWKSFEEARKLRVETRKHDEELADMLEKRAAAKKEQAIQQLASELPNRSAITDESRLNELRIAITQSVAYVESRLEMNVIFEIRTPKKAAATGEIDPDVQSAALAAIRESAKLMSELQERNLQQLLPTPDSSKTGGA